MKVDEIKNGIVIDHISAGNGLKIYQLLKLDELECSVAIIKNAIPFTNCHALESFTILSNWYAKNITIPISIISVTNLIGYSCHNLIYDNMFWS